MTAKKKDQAREPDPGASHPRAETEPERPDLIRRKLVEFLRASGVDWDAQSVRPAIPCFNSACPPRRVDEPEHARINMDTDTVTCEACGWEGDIYDVAGALASTMIPAEQRTFINLTLENASKANDVAKKNKAAEEKKKARDDARARATGRDASDMPFTMLGVGDDGRAAFIGRGERMLLSSTTTLTKSFLLALAPEAWWEEEYGHKGKIAWDTALDYIIGYSTQKDHDLSRVRGRGAWREKDGRICYHDGLETIGEPDAGRLYIRRPRRDIGLTGDECTPAEALELADVSARMSFKTELDHRRIMGWAILAPFAGALPWRPAILLTGASSSGKSTILGHVVNPLAEPLQISGGESTEAGVRQMIGVDSRGVCIDEADDDTEKKRRNREALFSLMRMSTSDDAPIVAKGTVDGKGHSFQMRSMFLFAAISPEVEAVADDNRIFRVNLALPDSEKWPALRSDLVRIVTPELCARMRARTWARLTDVIALANRLAVLIQDLSMRDARYSLAEGMLLAAYWLVLRDRSDISDKEFADDLLRLYNMAPPDAQRDDNEEVVDRILDERVAVDVPVRGMMTLREILTVVHSGKITTTEKGDLYDEPAAAAPATIEHMRAVAGRFGLAVKDGALSVAHNHHEIMRITGAGKGYHRALLRHAGLVDGGRMVWMAEKSRRCVVLRGIFEGEEK